MEFSEKVAQFAERANKIANDIKTEEATKASLIMPFFQMLGYDVFNPREFVPEYTADVGIKKGERIDYAIMVDGSPLILVECKPCGEPLENHQSQLFRYFATVGDAKFGILTDGITYRFYTDIIKTNLLDMRPFLELDLTKLRDSHINELSRFQRDKVDVDSIMGSAEAMMYKNMIKEWLVGQFDNPDDDFIRLGLCGIYPGPKTQKVIDGFRPLFVSSLEQFQVDFLTSHFRSAIKDSIGDAPETETKPDEDDNKGSIREITIEEIDAFAIVKSILYDICDVNRLTLRATKTKGYSVVEFDGNTWKRIVRFWLIGRKDKFITTPDENKEPIRRDIENLNDIYKYADDIREVCQRYL